MSNTVHYKVHVQFATADSTRYCAVSEWRKLNFRCSQQRTNGLAYIARCMHGPCEKVCMYLYAECTLQNSYALYQLTSCSGKVIVGVLAQNKPLPHTESMERPSQEGASKGISCRRSVGRRRIFESESSAFSTTKMIVLLPLLHGTVVFRPTLDRMLLIGSHFCYIVLYLYPSLPLLCCTYHTSWLTHK